MSKNYTVTHLHSDNSLLDSCTKYRQYIDKAVELGQKAICFSEHGNVHNWVEKKMYCDEKGVKFLFGIECYLTKELLNEDGKKVRDNYHTLLIGKNEEGRIELKEWIEKSSNKEHSYFKPRLSFEEFLSMSDNIIKISACLQSPLNRIRDLSIIEPLLKHYDYYEIQYHNNEEQIEYNRYLYEMSKKYNKKLIVGTDTHNIDDYHGECRVLLQLSKGIDFENEDVCDLSYKSYDEVLKMFETQNSLPMEVVIEALEETNVVADMCDDFTLDKSIKYPILYGEDDEKVMWEVLKNNYNDKLSKGHLQVGKEQEYIDNVKEEMRVFKKTNMVGFMLFMSELLTWCWENNIPTSPCRGSAGGSVVAFLTNITDVDPIKWKTVFSRFCNEYREEIGDIDIDIYKEQRPSVFEYIINRFGKEKTAFIITHGTIQDKGTIDDICKGLNKKWMKENNTNNDINSPYNLAMAKVIKAKYEENPEKTRKEYKEVFYYFDGMLNTKVSQSRHPAGIVASPINLIKEYSVFYDNEGNRILPINMEEIHEIGLAKYDILGLKNVGIIDKASQMANIPYPRSYNIDWEDKETFKSMLESPIGIFQFEENYAYSLLKKAIINNMPNVTVFIMSLVNACIRPSGESYRDSLIGGIKNKNPSEIIDDLLADNNGYLVYQEDTIKFLQNICGLSGSEADNVRRAIGRKQVDRLQEALPKILDGYCRMSDKPRSVAEEEAKQFLQIIEDSSSYQFG